MRTLLLGLTLIAVWALGGCASSPPPRQKPEAPAADPAAAAARISGDWQVAIERGGRSTEGWLHFALSSGELVGSLTGPDNNPREISKIVLRGDKISWQIENESVKETYEGKLKGSSMEGTTRVSRSGGGRRGGGSEGEEGSGGRSGGRRMGGGRGTGGRGGAASQITWRAYRSVQPITPAPAEPTKRD